jgi:uncharacterized membrane protein YagU involved in acid resistance
MVAAYYNTSEINLKTSIMVLYTIFSIIWGVTIVFLILYAAYRYYKYGAKW